jgi:hypothetical protein
MTRCRRIPSIGEEGPQSCPPLTQGGAPVKARNSAVIICFATLACSLAYAQKLSGPLIQVKTGNSGLPREVFSLDVDGKWEPVLSAAAPVHVRTGAGMESCPIEKSAVEDGELVLTGNCSVGAFVQHIALTAEDDIVNVSTRLKLKGGASVHSVEDRYDFLPPRHTAVDENTGPLDFVWSQNIKSEADDLVPTNSFKSPAVMMQQGKLFAALLPSVNERHAETRALDLDVTSNEWPWMAYGAIPSEPHGHSYFRRSPNVELQTIDGYVEYDYSIVLSPQPARLGYRRVVRLLWQRLGHPSLIRSPDEQQNVLRKELSSFGSWRKDAWQIYAGRVYIGFACGGRECGTLASNRNYKGEWDHPEPDAWFNPWFQTLRTAYGWYIYGRSINDKVTMAKAESILNLALSSPRKGGAFSTIYLVDKRQWIPSDGWAGYSDSYHTFDMSWTAYWMLRWAEDLTPARKAEILGFVKPYGEFLLAHQAPSGVIPSWYYASNLAPRPEFRDFNAETAVSALLLATLGGITDDRRFITGAERGMSFIEREVVPRQRWFDFETFLSCARKDYSFFDAWTAQYPQNNLAEIQAPAAMLALYRLTRKQEYLESGARMLDYLLLTQQVWNNPMYTPMLLGGFTTQNTDQEWSDARQGYAATVLADYYDATGNFEYLERAIAAARATFAVAPWENWAHSGYPDEPGALTGFHWGTGSAMTSVEILSPKLGDALIDLDARRGAGFDECSIPDVDISGDTIAFRIVSHARERHFLVRFRGIDAARRYRVVWNGNVVEGVSGTKLLTEGLLVGPLAG